MKIKDRICELKKRGSGVTAYFHWDMTTVNEALECANDSERFSLTMDLFRLWLDRSEETKEIYWEVLRYERVKEVYLSLSGDGRQLRIWFEKPERQRCRYEHVDSMGRGLLFEVLGAPDAVDKYLYGLLEMCPLQAKIWPHGARFFEKIEEES